MTRRRIRHRRKDAPNHHDDIEAASLPSRSRNASFKHVHEEIVVLENVARVFLSVAADSLSGGGLIAWAKFVTDSTPHRKISTDEEIMHFLGAKLAGGIVTTKKSKVNVSAEPSAEEAAAKDK